MRRLVGGPSSELPRILVDEPSCDAAAINTLVGAKANAIGFYRKEYSRHGVLDK